MIQQDNECYYDLIRLLMIHNNTVVQTFTFVPLALEYSSFVAAMETDVMTPNFAGILTSVTTDSRSMVRCFSWSA